MSKQSIRARENLITATELEKQGELENALKLFQKVATSDPLNEQAWNRSMVILRKLKKGPDELKLIKLAISSYQKAKRASQEQWVSANKEKVQSTRELAKSLGLLGPAGLPAIQSEALLRWQTRLHLLSHRLTNAKSKISARQKAAQKSKANKKPVQKKGMMASLKKNG